MTWLKFSKEGTGGIYDSCFKFMASNSHLKLAKMTAKGIKSDTNSQDEIVRNKAK